MIFSEKPEPITILDGEMKISSYFEIPEEDWEDNVFISLSEHCDEERALLCSSDTAFSMTSEAARKLAQMLLKAADQNDAWLANRTLND